MSNDKNKKFEPQPSQEDQEQLNTPQEPQEAPRGDCGDVGVATSALSIKEMWHKEHHVLNDIGDKRNPRKQQWVKRKGSPSLKRYARQLVTSGNQIAKDWFAHKDGALNEKRSDKNSIRIASEKVATKAAHRKKGQGKQKATTDAKVATK